jgi:hypothetical protein
MANMELIDVKTLSSAAGSITFSDIPQTYTDLKILVSARDDRDGQPNTDLSLQVGYNGTINTGSIYTNKQLYGNGSTAGSQSSSTTYAYLGMSNGPTSTANTFGNTEIYITNYASANNKSVSTDGVSENNATTAFAVLNANSIATSNPITDIKISAVYGSGNFQIGSTFYLYGISNVTSGTKATGGVVSTDGTYYYHMFPFSGTFTPTQSITADVLCIAGGGGGGGWWGGGGGAGGLLYFSSQSLTATGYTVTVGAGGSGGASASGSVGGDSQFGALTLVKGGGLGGYAAVGGNGGSGGGGGYGSAGGSLTSGQGNNGGSGTTGNAYSTGGGGGAGAAGGSASSLTSGSGGVGVNTYSSWATATQTGANNGYYAGGGGGGGRTVNSNISGSGGLGGGGAGAASGGSTFVSNGTAGTANTGGGGGGSLSDGSTGLVGGNGGSGLVIIRYTA